MQYQNEKKREKVKAEISKMQRQQKREKGRRGEEKKRERESALGKCLESPEGKKPNI